MRAQLIALCFLPLLLAAEQYSIELQAPIYCDGTLSTDQGGLIKGPGLYIQAEQMRYTKIAGTELIEASGALLVELGEVVLVGKQLFYDLQKREGTLLCGRVMVEPWFIGGETIDLLPDGSYHVKEAFVTTSESRFADWKLRASEASLQEGHLLRASQVSLQLFSLPLIWLPRLNLNFDTLLDNPVRYTIRTGDVEGPRVGIRYQFYTDDWWRVFGIVDYRLQRGVGGGLEAKYHSSDYKTRFHTINYVARDKSLVDREVKTRYRFQGAYQKCDLTDTTSVDLTYDLLSDQEMPTDYSDRGLREEQAGPTQLHFRHEEADWLVNFLTRVRLNIFQSIKQELPTTQIRYRPFTLGATEIIGEGQLKASYLDYTYTKNQFNPNDYSALRYELEGRFWRPFHIRALHLTPEVGGVAIYYGDSPTGIPRWTVVGKLKNELSFDLWRFWGGLKHAITPYYSHMYYSDPTTDPNDQYIFDISDGWLRLNMARFGLRQSWYRQNGCALSRPLFIDLWTASFFGSDTIDSTLYKLYSRTVYNQTDRLRHTIDAAWDFAQNRLDHANWRLQWTVDGGTALALEYRHRSPFAWRKVDYENYILDLFHTPEELKESDLSDRRDTLLIHLYHRYHRNWAFELLSRHGWNRIQREGSVQPSFTEYEANLHATFRSTWFFTFTFRHRVDDNRFSFNFNIGLNRPKLGIREPSAALAL